MPPPVVLAVGGLDPCCGAGVGADLKTLQALGVYGALALAVATVQDTREVAALEVLPAPFVRAQVAAVWDDLEVAAVKTGALGSPAVVEALAEELAARPRVPLVVDPVAVAGSGGRLGGPGVLGALAEHLLPRATVLTPNAPEAAALLGRPVEAREDLAPAARALRALGPAAVLLKGGHLEGDGPVADALCWVDEAGAERVDILEHPRLRPRGSHGTGCTLASAVAAGLALGQPVERAARHAVAYVQAALAAAPGLGRGNGPVGHPQAPHPGGGPAAPGDGGPQGASAGPGGVRHLRRS